jgi:purine-nucleoside phosphorylase
MPTSAAFAALAEDARRAPPLVGLVLGSGLCDVAARLKDSRNVSFLDVPGLAATSVAGHRGRLTLGTWAGRRVLVFEGRLHFYEGHPWRSVVLPVQTAAFLGARLLVATNAAGGIHDALHPGGLMAIRDHIDWTRPRCWRQAGPSGLGPPRPSPYTPRLLKLLTQAAHVLGLVLPQGVYAAVTGPCYETPAEIRALRSLGADAVGMSTAREVEAGREAGLECAAVSCITNRAAGLSDGPIHHGEVLTTAAAQSARLANLLEQFLLLL